MNMSNVVNAENKNLQARNSIIKNVVRNSENLKVSSDSRFNPSNSKHEKKYKYT